MYHWTWFFLIPGIEDGRLVPGLSEVGKHYAYAVPTAWFVVAVLSGLAFMANRGLAAARARGGTMQYVPDSTLTARNTFEMYTEGILNMVQEVLGTREAAVTYLPLIGTVFIFILVNNLLGLIPGFLPATGEISTNAAMSLVIFFVFNIAGIKANGMGYFKHLLGPVAAIAPLMFLLETIGLFVRPVSLSLRLFGNINGDHMVFGVFSELFPFVLPSIFLGLGVLVSFIQAFVFSLLSIVYVALSVAHEDDHH